MKNANWLLLCVAEGRKLVNDCCSLLNCLTSWLWSESRSTICHCDLESVFVT